MIMTMKVITGVALALATVMSSSAFAQTTRVNPWDAYQAYGQAEYGPRANQPRHSPRRSWDVYNSNGRYVGSDPDPNVREMIARDHQEQLDSGF
jgi:hypothetical protein